MTGAMYAAIGGLRSHMSKLNVIGNNIANVNTYGYKSQRMTFKESIYGTSRSGSNGGAVTGGNNPSQTGYGCTVGTIDLNMSPSTYSPTGVDLDCYIAGDGFFLVGDKLTRNVEYYTQAEVDAWQAPANDPNATKPNVGDIKSVTWSGGITEGDQLKDYEVSRVGDFWIDPDGYICNGDGKVVYGFARVQNPDYVPNAPPEAIAAAKALGRDIESETVISSHMVPLRVPLQAAAPTEANGGKVYVDEDGNQLPDTATDAEKAAAEVKYLWEEGDPVYPFVDSNGLNQYADPDMQKTGTQGKWDNAVNGVANGPACQGVGTTRIPVAENMAGDRVSNVMPCQMKEVAIGSDGSIVGVANGQSVVLGYIGIVSADNPNGMTHTSGPYYKCMPGAGNMRVSTAGLEIPGGHLGNKVTDGEPSGIYGLDPDALGGANTNDKIWNESEVQLQSQGLEASSTDLAQEFAEMVTTQRGYQANTRIVTVTDSMLEELVNMKR